MFHINLFHQPSNRRPAEVKSQNVYDDNLHDVYALIADICDKLQDLNVARFAVGGFGQSEWPVDVRYDLLSFLEQIESVLVDMRTKTKFDISFPEQGIQRTVHIVQRNNVCQLSCSSFGRWKPDARVVDIKTIDLRAMLVSVVNAFLAISATYFVSISRHPWFVEWEQKLRCSFDA